MLLDNWLAQRAETCPDTLAVRDPHRAVSYRELEGEASSVARRLAARGVRAGQTVAVAIDSGVEYAVLLHALMKLGAIASPLNTRLTPTELETAAAASDPVLVITDPDEFMSGDEADLPLLGELQLDAPHCRILTSGTSGAPEPITLTYGNHLWSAVGSGFNLGVDPDDRWLCCLPLFHISGLSIVMRSAIYGTGAVMHPRFGVDEIAASLESDGVTIVSLVATQLGRLLDAGVDLSRPRAILVGGGPVPVGMLEEAASRDASVVQTYGMTETASQITTLSLADASRKPGSAGRPLLTTHIRIHGGEILVQGPTVADGVSDEDGWLHTGDLGRIDEEGFLYVEDRIKDLIVSGGENVHPSEVEPVLLGHESIAEVAVVGRADPEWQEAVTAVVVPVDGHEPDPEAIRAYCAERLAGYKVPRTIEFTRELPRSPSGKLIRRLLR